MTATKMTLGERAGGLDLKAAPAYLGRIIGMASRYPWRLSAVVLASLGSAVTTLTLPHLLGRGIDQAQIALMSGTVTSSSARPVPQALIGIAIGLIVVSGLRGLLQMISGYFGESLGQHVGYDLRMAFFNKLQILGFAYHDANHSGDLITKGMLDLEGVRVFVEMGMQRTVSLGLLLVVGAVLLVSTDPLMAVLALSFVPFVMFRAVTIGLALRGAWTRVQVQMSVLTRIMEEGLEGMRVVRAFYAKAFELAKFDQVSQVALKLSNTRIVLRTRTVATMTFAYYLSMALVLGFGGVRIRAGTMTLGHLTEVLTLMTLLQQPVRQLMMIVNSSARAASCAGRLFGVLDLEPTVRNAPGANALVLSNVALRFENVSFAYPNGPDVLRNISFEVRRGQTLGLIGASGAGKSSLGHLVPRFYDVTQGRILIDGQDIRDVTLTSLRQAIGLVSQSAFLFDDSVAANIAYAEPPGEEGWDGDDEMRIVQAAETSQIHEHVTSLDSGYASYVGERGVSLSGGQKQRLSIARGVLPEPSLLILDDATSALDSATERNLQDALRGRSTQQTTLIMAHRISSVQHADEILVLAEGRIIERGRHEALKSQNGVYAALCYLQTDSVDALAAALPEAQA